MRKPLLLIGALAIAGSMYGHGDRAPATSCDDVKMEFGEGESRRAAEVLTIPAGALDVEADQNGGLSVIGSTGTSYRVQICKFAGREEDLAAIRAVVSGRALRVEGSGENRGAFLIIDAPAGSQLTLAAKNGPITISGLVRGSIDAEAQNGPIGVTDTTGDITAKTQNGPLSVSGASSGTFRLKAQNGPVSVKFEGSEWQGELDAETSNGPLSVTLPSGFQSGVSIETTRGHVSCDCENARRFSDDPKKQRIEFGTGPTVVRLSTVNGPLTVKTR
jgi:hypothetical protein